MVPIEKQKILKKKRIKKVLALVEMVLVVKAHQLKALVEMVLVVKAHQLKTLMERMLMVKEILSIIALPIKVVLLVMQWLWVELFIIIEREFAMHIKKSKIGQKILIMLLKIVNLDVMLKLWL